MDGAYAFSPWHIAVEGLHPAGIQAPGAAPCVEDGIAGRDLVPSFLMGRPPRTYMGHGGDLPGEANRTQAGSRAK